jgi:hypothetical protein
VINPHVNALSIIHSSTIISIEMADNNYISKPDYKYQIRTERLDQILEATDEDEDLLLDSAEGEALAILRDHLGKRYNMDVEFSKAGDNRNKVVLRWAKVLVLYFIYERIPDEMVPERIVSNYENVLAMLVKVEDGKKDVIGLTPITETDSNGNTGPATRRRWGSIAKRTNDGGSPRNLI